MKSYFIKNKIEDVFVTLGILSYPHEKELRKIKHFPGRIHIKKIFIGLEKRRFKRILYKADIKFLLAKDKTEQMQAVDLSRGGLCFVSKRLLKTDSEVEISMELPKSKKTIHTMARVAWIKRMERATKEAVNKYQIGLEFVSMKDKDRKLLSKELKSG